MTRIVPEISRNRGSVRNVLDHAVGLGAVAPPWIAVEQPSSPGWLCELGALTGDDRARSVAAVATEEGLALAARLGFGGALWLPPSTVAMRNALDAASSSPAAASTCDPTVLDVVSSRPGPLWLVAWPGGGFWRYQLGSARLLALLAELARILEVLPAALAGPALLVADRSSDDIEAAWDRLAGSSPVPPSPVVAPVPDGEDRVMAAAAMVVDLDARDGGAGMEPQPVYALPSGQLVGWWSPTRLLEPIGTQWLAAPGCAGDPTWLAPSTRGEALRIRETATSEGLENDTADALRAPGWMGIGIRPGSPSALMVERLVTVATRMARPLWVPNVDPDGLRFLLRLGGELWVDGPAVPSR